MSNKKKALIYVDGEQTDRSEAYLRFVHRKGEEAKLLWLDVDIGSMPVQFGKHTVSRFKPVQVEQTKPIAKPEHKAGQTLLSSLCRASIGHWEYTGQLTWD